MRHLGGPNTSHDGDGPEGDGLGAPKGGGVGTARQSDIVRAGASTAALAVDHVRAQGYWVAFRDDGFCECLITQGDEKWIGRGHDETRALLDALGKMFPSRLAWQLLEGRVGRTDESFVPPRRDRAGTVAAASALPADPARALRALTQLHHEMSASRAAVARMAPDRQRLVIQGWMAAARAEQESLPKTAEVVRAVAAIAKELGSLCKLYWPGSVRALQSTAEPTSVHAGAATWAAAAAGAREALERAVVQGLERGLDVDGWADQTKLAPGPATPELVLRDVVVVLEEATGPLSGQPRSVHTSAGTNKQLTLAAAKLRWLRGATCDVERWAQALGRLRWIASQPIDLARELQATLDPAFAPALPWAEVVRAATPAARV